MIIDLVAVPCFSFMYSESRINNLQLWLKKKKEDCRINTSFSLIFWPLCSWPTINKKSCYWESLHVLVPWSADTKLYAHCRGKASDLVQPLGGTYTNSDWVLMGWMNEWVSEWMSYFLYLWKPCWRFSAYLNIAVIWEGRIIPDSMLTYSNTLLCICDNTRDYFGYPLGWRRADTLYPCIFWKDASGW